jgi:hypothetical protein
MAFATGSLNVLNGPATLTGSGVIDGGFGILTALSDSLISISGSMGQATFTLKEGRQYESFMLFDGVTGDSNTIRNFINIVTIHNSGTILCQRLPVES